MELKTPVYFAGTHYFTRQELENDFNHDNTTPHYVDLMIKYFPNGWTIGNIRIEKEDRADVLRIVETKIQGLRDLNSHRGLLVNARPLRIVEELELLQKSLIRPQQKVLTADEQVSENQLKKIKALSAERLYTILYQTAWWLLHPRDVPTDVRKCWLDILEQNKQSSSLDVLLRLMDKNKSSQTQLKTFMDLDVAGPVGSRKLMDQAAMDTAASLGKGPREMHTKLKERLQQVFDIFGTLGFLSKSRVTNVQKAQGSELDTVIKALPKEIATKLLSSMAPIYKFYETEYGDAYTLIETFIKTTFKDFGGPQVPTNFPIDSILMLLDRTTQIRSDLDAGKLPKEGLVRLTDIPTSSEPTKDVVRKIRNLMNDFHIYMSKKTSTYKNSSIKTADSQSSRLYDLLSGAEDTILQISNPTVKILDSRSVFTGRPDKRELATTIDTFFKDSPKTIYVAVQPRTQTKDIKELNNLKPTLNEFPKTAQQPSLDKFNEATATTPSFSSLSRNITPTPFVESITDRSAALMAVIYFRLTLERIVPRTVTKRKLPQAPVVGNAATAIAGQATATATTVATTDATGAQPQPVPTKD